MVVDTEVSKKPVLFNHVNEHMKCSPENVMPLLSMNRNSFLKFYNIFSYIHDSSSNNVKTINPNDPSFWSEYDIKKVPGDGHCFMHALSFSFMNQKQTMFSVDMLLRALHNECETSWPKYSKLFTLGKSSFIYLKNKYINERVYNNDFGDFVPNIMSRALHTRIYVIESINGSYQTHKLQDEGNTDMAYTEVSPLLMFKSGLHYDSIVLKRVASSPRMSERPTTHRLHDNVPAGALAANADRSHLQVQLYQARVF